MKEVEVEEVKQYVFEVGWTVCHGDIMDTPSGDEKQYMTTYAENKEEAIENVKTFFEDNFESSESIEKCGRGSTGEFIYYDEDDNIVETDYNFTAKRIRRKPGVEYDTGEIY